ncbi:hypothetical protein VNI00_019282 [Paramarasmius palmivorus]|uniref:Uncharacterized protein n=1 Tax=Paramarasmius palmivorus TaxID=297713 RepID=A0AAW0APE5_9AGAR
MTNSDPENIASIRSSARLDLEGEEERIWLKDRFAHAIEDEDSVTMMQRYRRQFRGLLVKREASHARYLRNRETLKTNALQSQKLRINTLRRDPTAWEDFREDRRLTQSRYYQRNRDILNAKARERRAIKKKQSQSSNANAQG